MPSKNKRINLTVPPDLYETLQEFKKRFHFRTDATACMFLIEEELEYVYAAMGDDDNARN